MTKQGKLIGIGIGPGDPELITLRAIKLIKRAQVIAVPYSGSGSDSMALTTAKRYIRPDAEILRLPFAMVKDQPTRKSHRNIAAEQITQRLEQGLDVAFISEGDVMLYSTFSYMLDLLKDKYKVEIVPGISSVMASAAQAQIPLALNHQRLIILPVTHISLTELKWVLNHYDTVVLLKINMVIEILISILKETGRLGQAVVVEHASMQNCRVFEDIVELKNSQLSYMSQMIVSGNKRRNQDAD